MKIAVYIGKEELKSDPRILTLSEELREAGCDVCGLVCREDMLKDTDFVMSVGGDGTYLSVAMLVADSGIPVVGVNLGRMGFLETLLRLCLKPHMHTGASRGQVQPFSLAFIPTLTSRSSRE